MKRYLLLISLAILTGGCLFARPRPTTQPVVAATETSPVATETFTAIPPSETPNPPTATPTTELTQTPAAYGPTDFPAHVDPLTGKEISDPQLLERRPVAVKVQMFPRGQRPPWGVSLADIVYDYYQNFGLTRFHAIFYSQDAQMVGPVRSARLLDIDLVAMYKSIFAFGSAERRTYSRLFGQDFAPRLVVEGNGTCPPLCRMDPNGYNYLVANTKDLSAYVATKGVDNARQKLDGMRFEAAPPTGGQAGQQIYIRYSISAYARWDYDAASGRYLRWQDVQEAADQQGEAYEPLVDRLNNQQITADNVVILIVPHQYAFNSRPGPNEVIDIGLTGSGPAYAFRDGQMFEATWNRPTKDSVLYLTLSDGSLYAFKPGNTWYQVVGKTSKISVEAGVWRFQHLIP
jgi:hypothetical protein